MYRWELVEGKYRLKELVRPEFETGLGTSSMALIWRMNKPFWGKGDTVIMDSVLCVLKGFIGMRDIVRVVYGSAVVKKFIYWP